MNTKTYQQIIAKQFGGAMIDVLLVKLDKLIIMAKLEQKNSVSPKIKDMPKPKIKTVKAIKPRQFVEFAGNYGKALKFIQENDKNEWIAIAEVPDELFKDFWNILEMHPEITLDEERDCQYFKVDKFCRK